METSDPMKSSNRYGPAIHLKTFIHGEDKESKFFSSPNNFGKVFRENLLLSENNEEFDFRRSVGKMIDFHP